MWLFTTDGFFSVVSKGCRPDQLMVRARVRADLQRAFPGAKITTSQSTDYRFRVIVTRKAMVALLARTVEKLNYANFKETVSDGNRHNAYIRVWNAMYALQERPKPKVSPMLARHPYTEAEVRHQAQVDDEEIVLRDDDRLKWFGGYQRNPKTEN